MKPQLPTHLHDGGGPELHALCLATVRPQPGQRKPGHPKTWPTPLDAWASPLCHHGNLRDAGGKKSETLIGWSLPSPSRNPEVSEFARLSSVTKDPTLLLK